MPLNPQAPLTQPSLYRRLLAVLSGAMVKRGFWFTFGAFGEKGILFLSIPLLTHLLTPAEYGIAAIFMTWTLLLRTIAPANVQASVVRALFDFDERSFGAYFSSILSLGWVTTVGTVALAFILPDAWLEWASGIDAGYVRLAAFAGGGGFAVVAWQNRWKAKYEYKPFVLSVMLLAAVQVALSLALIIAMQSERQEGRMWGLAAPAIAYGFVLSWRSISKARVLFNRKYWAYALSFSLPLIPHLMANVILAQFDRVMIARYLGDEEAGVYSLAYQFGETASLLWMVANGLWVPWFFRQLNNGLHEEIRAKSLQYSVGFTGIAVVMMGSMPLAIRLVAPPEFLAATQLIPLVITVGVLQVAYSFYANVSFYEKKTGIISLGTALAATLNIGLNYWALPKYGFVGAAWTTIASYGVLFLLQAAVVRYRSVYFPVFSFPALASIVMIAVGFGWFFSILYR